MLAALELTPTSAFFSSTRNRRVSVPSRQTQPAVALEARASSARDARASGASVDTAALSAWACHTGAAPGCRDSYARMWRPGVRSSAGRDWP